MGPPEWILLVLASAAGAAVNAVAGGGSLISWPAALAVGLSPVHATATNTVAMTPGALASAWAYRRELASNGRWAGLLALPAALGSFLGSLALLAASEQLFNALVPWLILGASGLVVAKQFFLKSPGALPGTGAARAGRRFERPIRIVAVTGGLFGVAVYGGYFGAGLGIMILGLLALGRPMDIHQMNAVKTLLSGVVNGIAAVYFLTTDAAHREAALAMILGTSLGGYAAASLARRADPRWVASAVGVIGVCLGAYVGYDRWG